MTKFSVLIKKHRAKILLAFLIEGLAILCLWFIGFSIDHQIRNQTGQPTFEPGAKGFVGQLALGLAFLLYCLSAVTSVLIAQSSRAEKNWPLEKRKLSDWQTGLIQPLEVLGAALLVGGLSLSVYSATTQPSDRQVSVALLMLGSFCIGGLAGGILQAVLNTPFTPLALLVTASASTCANYPDSWYATSNVIGVLLFSCLAGSSLAAGNALRRKHVSDLVEQAAIEQARQDRRQAEKLRKQRELAELQRKEENTRAQEVLKQQAAREAETRAHQQLEEERIRVCVTGLDAQFGWYLGDEPHTTYYVGGWAFEHVRDRDSRSLGHSFIQVLDDKIVVAHDRPNSNTYAYTNDRGIRYVVSTDQEGGDHVWPLYRQYISAYQRYLKR